MLTPVRSPAARQPLLDLDPELGAHARPRALRCSAARAARRPTSSSSARLGRRALERPTRRTPACCSCDGVLAREIVSGGAVASDRAARPGRPAAAVARRARRPTCSRVDGALGAAAHACWPRGARPARDARCSARWPEIGAILLDRVDERAHRLAVTQAIAQLTGIERRLHALLWHLAGALRPRHAATASWCRWRCRTGGSASSIGARRPTVSTALGALAREGRLRRRADGGWLLTGAPPQRFGGGGLGEAGVGASGRPWRSRIAECQSSLARAGRRAGTGAAAARAGCGGRSWKAARSQARGPSASGRGCPGSGSRTRSGRGPSSRLLGVRQRVALGELVERLGQPRERADRHVVGLPAALGARCVNW